MEINETNSTSKKQIEEILTSKSNEFLKQLHITFNNRIETLLKERISIQEKIDNGFFPDFLNQTKTIRNDTTWNVGKIPTSLVNRTVEITGPVDRKIIINALNSGANCFMADFEDSSSPSFNNMLNGQINLRDAINGDITYNNKLKNKTYKLNEKTATLLVRPRGLHSLEKNVSVDNVFMRASLFDFGLYFITNYNKLLEKDVAPYFYLPKLENHNEAKLWNDIFTFSENYVKIPIGTIKTTVLIEHICAVFEMDEILFSLKNHIVALNTGRWDYIFSFIKKFRYNPNFILGNRNQITMKVHFMKSYVKLLVQTCHKRGAYAIGGMAAHIPTKNEEINKINLEKVYQDKLQEAKQGMDGTWIAHPALLKPAIKAFSKYKKGYNQLYVNPTYIITSEDLLKVPKGIITEDGVRTNIVTCLKYLDSWINGIGCVAINNKMEDAATAEISRIQLWQWRYHKVKINNILIDENYINKIILEDKTSYEHDFKIKNLLKRMLFTNIPDEFMTNLAYDLIKN